MMKGNDMSVAHVTLGDYISEAADEFEAFDRYICPKIHREAYALKLVRTSATSGLRITFYKTNELSEKMLPMRVKILEQCPGSIQDIFHLEGPVGLHYVNELLLENKAI